MIDVFVYCYKNSNDVDNNNYYNDNKRYDDDGNNNMVKETYAPLLSLHPSLSHSLDCTFFCWAWLDESTCNNIYRWWVINRHD